MQEDIARLCVHLYQPDFRFHELRLSEAAEAACRRWPLLRSINAGAPSEPERQEAGALPA